MLVDRYSFGYIRHKNKIYVIGGCNYDSINHQITTIDSAEIYDIDKNKWIKICNFPVKIKSSRCLIY